MVMVRSAESVSPQDAIKQLEALKAHEANLDRKQAEYLRGRNIDKAEREAEAKLEAAKIQAQQIIDDAERTKSTNEESLAKAKEILASTESRKAELIAKAKDIKERESRIDAREQALELKESSLTAAERKAKEAEERYNKKLADVTIALQGLVNGG